MNENEILGVPGRGQDGATAQGNNLKNQLRHCKSLDYQSALRGNTRNMAEVHTGR